MSKNTLGFRGKRLAEWKEDYSPVLRSASHGGSIGKGKRGSWPDSRVIRDLKQQRGEQGIKKRGQGFSGHCPNNHSILVQGASAL